MQAPARRSNKDRTATMRASLMAAARGLFLQRGFAATGTPDIVAAAGVTRGALYHHFADKEALFAAVVEAEAQAVADAVRGADYAGMDAIEALIRGGQVYLSEMRLPGRSRMLLLDAPAVLGRVRLAEIDAATGGATLAEGLLAAQASGAMVGGAVGPLAGILSAGFDRAALALDAGEDADLWQAAMAQIIRGVARP